MNHGGLPYRRKSKAPLDPAVRAKLAKIVAAHGVTRAAVLIGSSTITIEAAASGAPLTARGRAAIERYCAR